MTEFNRIEFDCIQTDDGYKTLAGVPMATPTYCKWVTDIKELTPEEQDQLFIQFIQLRAQIDGIINWKPKKDHKLAEIYFEKVIESICEARGVTYDQLKSKTRERNVVYPRQLCMFILVAKTKMSLKEIGRRFGGRDHTTVIHSCQTIKNLMETYSEVRAEVHYFLQREYTRESILKVA